MPLLFCCSIIRSTRFSVMPSGTVRSLRMSCAIAEELPARRTTCATGNTCTRPCVVVTCSAYPCEWPWYLESVSCFPHRSWRCICVRPSSPYGQDKCPIMNQRLFYMNQKMSLQWLSCCNCTRAMPTVCVALMSLLYITSQTPCVTEGEASPWSDTSFPPLDCTGAPRLPTTTCIRSCSKTLTPTPSTSKMDR